VDGTCENARTLCRKFISGCIGDESFAVWQGSSFVCRPNGRYPSSCGRRFVIRGRRKGRLFPFEKRENKVFWAKGGGNDGHWRTSMQYALPEPKTWLNTWRRPPPGPPRETVQNVDAINYSNDSSSLLQMSSWKERSAEVPQRRIRGGVQVIQGIATFYDLGGTVGHLMRNVTMS